MLKLTHANHKRPVWVSRAHIAAIYQATDGSTHIVSVGAVIPVLESVDDVIRLIAGEEKPQKEEGNG
jgi:hypothetical protein